MTLAPPRQLLVLLGTAVIMTLNLALAWVQPLPIASTTRTSRQLVVVSSANKNDRRQHTDDNSNENNSAPIMSRRRALVQTTFAAASSLLITSATAFPAHALVKGVPPPPPKTRVSDSIIKKCTNVEECQAAAELKEQAQRESDMRLQVPAQVTAGGTRYRDLEIGTGSAAVAANGDEVVLYYKVLKLGKRAYDGLSGEGTVVFSRGYGLEDDETKPGTKAFVTTVGAYANIMALNEVVPGMKVGGIRRFVVLPQQGWRKPTKACDGGPGGSGAGGDLKTDYVVVPTATMVAEEACFDQSRQPFPVTYGQQRRMAQRFDQSLCMEVQLVSVGPSSSGL